jgi:serine phosphatase RsbU (regulator of sigma subunit)
VKESLFNEENTQKSIRSEMNFNFEKKEQAARLIQEKKDAIAKEEKQREKLIRNTYLAGFALVLVLVLVVWRSYRVKKKANKQLHEKNLLIEEQKHLTEQKHKEITDSINYAERIQRAFLASGELLDKNLNNYFVMFKPRDIVSGDFYWASELSNGNFIMATADSTGHGVPGAIMSLLNITSLEKAIERNTDPAKILDDTRKAIIERLKKDGSAEGGKDGMDCSLLVFDLRNMQLHVAAAHNPVWIVRSEAGKAELTEIKPDKMPIGKHDKDQEPFTLNTIELKKKDIIYTLTDGFPDQFGGDKGKKFMSRNLRELLVSHSHLPMQEQKRLLEEVFQNWKGDLEQVDDVTVIGVQI